MTRRVCSEPDCPNLTDAGRCPPCTRKADLARGTRQQRGYGPEHDKGRAHWLQLVEAGQVDCSRCHEVIVPGTAWHYDHTDDRASWRGPSHARCNLAAAGKAAHR